MRSYRAALPAPSDPGVGDPGFRSASPPVARQRRAAAVAGQAAEREDAHVPRARAERADRPAPGPAVERTAKGAPRREAGLLAGRPALSRRVVRVQRASRSARRGMGVGARQRPAAPETGADHRRHERGVHAEGVQRVPAVLVASAERRGGGAVAGPRRAGRGPKTGVQRQSAAREGRGKIVETLAVRRIQCTYLRTRCINV